MNREMVKQRFFTICPRCHTEVDWTSFNKLQMRKFHDTHLCGKCQALATVVKPLLIKRELTLKKPVLILKRKGGN